jgi:hypothetical protein
LNINATVGFTLTYISGQTFSTFTTFFSVNIDSYMDSSSEATPEYNDRHPLVSLVSACFWVICTCIYYLSCHAHPSRSSGSHSMATVMYQSFDSLRNNHSPSIHVRCAVVLNDFDCNRFNLRENMSTYALRAQLNFWSFAVIFVLSAIALNYWIRFRYLNVYTQLKEPPLVKPDANELHPDVNTGTIVNSTSSGLRRIRATYRSACHISQLP